MKVEAVDPDILFQDGTEAFKADKFEEAGRYFALVTDRFPDSDVARPALFNLGLARLRFGRPAEAAAAFWKFVETYPDDDDIGQIRRRLAEALLEAGEWTDAEKVVAGCLGRAGLSTAVELELHADMVKALRKQGRLREARGEVDRAMEIYDAHLVDPDIKGNFHAAMASFEGGEVWHDLFNSVKFILPKDRMEKDLTDKGTLFLKAQADYLRTVRVGNLYWASKAGVRIGQLYEEFYDDIMNAEVPPELNQRDLEAYRAELRRQARPMLQKAVDLYERNMKVSRSYGAKDEWFTDMKARLDRLKELLKNVSR
jgi:tetratricopeptide (TPR) repeat protein